MSDSAAEVPEPTYDFDIAVSFAGEDRAYVNEFVNRLKAVGIEVFYDQDQLADMWGENLVDFLQAVYNRRARFAILFVSRNYIEKKWPGHERQAAQDRALQESSPYILPVRLDDSELPGLHSTIAYMDARYIGIDGMVDAVQKKLDADGGKTTPPAFDGRVPTTSEGIATLLSERPVAWEYMLYAATIRQGIDAAEDKYRDHLVEYAARNGTVLHDDSDPIRWLQAHLGSIHDIIDQCNVVMSERAQEAAFGEPGSPGDPDRIIHLGRRLVNVYEEILDWSSRIRGTTISDEHVRRVAAILARFANQPVEAFRSFATDMTAQFDGISDRLADGETVELKLTLKVELDDELGDEFTRALEAYAAAATSESP